MLDKKTIEILDKYEKEQEENRRKRAKKREEKIRVDNYIEGKFYEKYFSIFILSGLPVSIAAVWFIFFTKIFNDGLLRFLIAMLLVMSAGTIARNIATNKIRNELTTQPHGGKNNA